jgi:HK97 family phage major capsid protein/HK97 family phage prohead protease
MKEKAKQRLQDGAPIPSLCRAASFRAGSPGAALDAEARTLTLTWSSEQPVDRWFGQEILSHDPGSARLGRLNDGAPLLFNHRMDDVIGVVESAALGGDKKGHAVVRFARTPRGDEMMGMAEDGILRNVSFMYQVHKFRAELDEDNNENDIYTATDWEPYEISMVTIPADPTVGVGRASGTESTHPVRIERTSPAAHAASTEEVSMRHEHRLHAPAGDGGDAGGDAPDPANNPVKPGPVVDAERIRKDAAQSEQERILAINALGARHKLPADFIAKLISDGTKIEAARGLVLDHISQGGAQSVAHFDHQRVDLTDKEARSYSLVRAVNAIIAGDWSAAGFEREVSNTIAKKVGRNAARAGFFIPSNLPFVPTQEHARAMMVMGGPIAQRMLQQRAIYQVGTPSQGGNLVETQLLAESFIEVLRNMSIVMQLGARTLTGLVGGIDIPRQITTTPTYWVGESGGLTEGEATFDKVQLRPKVIGALSKMSRLMLQQSTPAIEMLAREDLLSQMALGIDLAALSGTGSSNQPTGVVNQSGVGSVIGGTNGANLTFDHLIQLYTAPAVANAPMGSMAFAMNAKAKGYLATLKSSTGAYLWAPQGGGVGSPVADNVQGYPYGVSNQLRSTLTKGTASGIASELIYGNWRELLIGEWGVTEIMVNPYGSTDFAAGDVAIRAFQTIDVAVRHGASFSVMSDALTPGF